MLKAFKFFIAAFVILFFCKCDDDHANVPDVSGVDADISIIRFDEELSKIDTINSIADIKILKAKYPAFFDLYFKRIIPIYSDDESIFYQKISDFIKDYRIVKLQDTVSHIFKDFSKVEQKIESSLQYYQYYFPTKDIPNVYTLISEFSYQGFLFNDEGQTGIGIGLDYFLGKEFEYKKIDPQNPAYSNYLTTYYEPGQIARKCMELLINDMLPPPSKQRMLDHIIYEGKKWYLLEKLLPYESKENIVEYTNEELNWSNNNILEMWTFFLEKSLLDESRSQQMNRYILPAPTSPGMPPESPGKTGVFLGWKIITSLMEKNPDLTLDDLINMTDADQILRKSRFKPARK